MKYEAPDLQNRFLRLPSCQNYNCYELLMLFIRIVILFPKIIKLDFGIFSYVKNTLIFIAMSFLGPMSVLNREI